MRLRVGTLVELVQVVEDLVLAASRPAVRADEDGDLVRVGNPSQLVAVVGIRGDLPERDADPELGQPLPYLVRVGAPLCLVELHHGSVLRACRA